MRLARAESCEISRVATAQADSPAEDESPAFFPSPGFFFFLLFLEQLTVFSQPAPPTVCCQDRAAGGAAVNCPAVDPVGVMRDVF